MIAVALKGLAARKVRALLTAFAVVIGVSMVSGTFILTDTMQKTFDGLFAASYEETDAVIAGKQIVETSTSGSATIPAPLLDRGRGAARGRGRGRRGHRRRRSTPPTSSAVTASPSPRRAWARASTPANPRFSPFELKSGDWPAGPRQVAIDAGTAKQEGLAVGDTRQDRRRPAARRPTSHRHRLASARSTRSASAASPSGTSRPRSPCSAARAVRHDLAGRERGHVAG